MVLAQLTREAGHNHKPVRKLGQGCLSTAPRYFTAFSTSQANLPWLCPDMGQGSLTGFPTSPTAPLSSQHILSSLAIVKKKKKKAWYFLLQPRKQPAHWLGSGGRSIGPECYTATKWSFPKKLSSQFGGSQGVVNITNSISTNVSLLILNNTQLSTSQIFWTLFLLLQICKILLKD